jgi:hypothetical protein
MRKIGVVGGTLVMYSHNGTWAAHRMMTGRDAGSPGYERLLPRKNNCLH